MTNEKNPFLSDAGGFTDPLETFRQKPEQDHLVRAPVVDAPFAGHAARSAYVFHRSAPAVSKSALEDGDREAIVVEVYWGDEVIQLREFAPFADFTIGDGSDSKHPPDVVVPSA